jgi:molybdenum ABC transporter molybdate-binding protein
MLGLAAASAAAASVVPGAARAEPWLRTYVVVYCDPTLKPVLRRAAAHFAPGPVTLFSAPPALAIGLLEHGTQDDLLITTPEMAQDAANAGVLAPHPIAAPLYANHLVIAASHADAAPLAALDAPTLMARLGSGRFALTDATKAATIDAPAVIGKLGLADALKDRIIPAANTDEVTFLIRTGAAKLGLCHRTDVRIDDSLVEVAAVPDASYPPIRYCISQTKTAWSANMDAFVAYMASPQASGVLTKLGLERL